MVITRKSLLRKSGHSQLDLLIPEGFEPAKFKRLPVPVQTMLKRMSSARQRSEQTLKSYSETAVTFFNILGEVRAPTEQDWHDYFMIRRRRKISDATLTKEFAHLKKLAETNHYRWPFSKEDVPRSSEEPYAPTFSVDQVEQLIKAWPEYTLSEKFYLSISTVWAPRANELISIHKRDYDTQTILFHKSKREKSVRRLIPDELKPLFSVAHPTMNNKSSAAAMFARICDKAGVKREHRQSFHSIRHSLTTVLLWAAAEHRIDQSLVGEYMAWSKTKIGQTFGGSPMVGVYRKTEALSDDPFWLDKQILPIHPFLKLWQGVTP